ncbi:ADP-ribosylation factor-binding protein GGA3 [Diorhabda carinulata]|uniref:ADP-ribosylation factor-binding protein GGA3 n=1 Tax=Diorhabda carinulata TaxID=1163345 RepID=UPI0025A22DE8|nr:ADP-ribosylation factor-binding protein GGA3 [Diorhabda carinulata]
MDLLTQTSLEALLLKATNTKNLNFDTVAVEAFCSIINKEKDGPQVGVKVIAARLPSGDEREMLQTLNVLDHCMSKCGTNFQNEVGKFRFLNELIKLVSPKYLGSQTPLTVKQKILQLFYVWTLDYPKEIKIVEAFDMLRKQGVVRDIPNPNVPLLEGNAFAKRKNVTSIFQDEEKSKILQKLLQSKDPEDIQAANWLIKSMVKEDDKRAELKSKRISELESVQNNVRLLNEMLDSYKPTVSSIAELDLIKELYQNCESLRPSVNKLILETHLEEGILDDVLKTSDELSIAFDKYNILIIQGRQLPMKRDSNHSLLQFDNPNSLIPDKNNSQNGDAETSLDVLCDIFSSSTIPDSADLLQPLSITKEDTQMGENSKDIPKLKGLEELDVLGDHLMKENLQSCRINNEKVPMNILNKISEIKQNQLAQKHETNQTEIFNLDLNYLLKSKNDVKSSSDTNDDCLVDISDEIMLEVDKNTDSELIHTVSLTKTEKSVQEKNIKLNDIFVKLESIRPSGLPPMVILNDKNGITVSLHLAKDEPKDGVNVFVITTVSKNESPLNNYLFQAVVPKGCKLKLQPPSSTDLPVYNPFLPPMAITQILLVGNPESVAVSLKFIISYIMDEETITEMGEVEELPRLR